MKATPESTLGKIKKNKKFQFFVIGLLGFSSGLPFLLCFKTLQVWLNDAHVNLQTIGLFSSVLIPYSLKFLWAPFFDRTDPLRLGRRHSWLVITQVATALCIFAFCFFSPEDNPLLFATLAFLLAFASASQDVVIDAVRREVFDDADLGLASTFTIYGYRIAMWISGGVVLVVSEKFMISWQAIYAGMGALMLIGLLATGLLVVPERQIQRSLSLAKLFWDPLKDFFLRSDAIFILLFILIYKIGDVMAGSLLNKYYLDMGYTKAEIGTIAKTFGLVVTLVGSLIGGFILQKVNLKKCLIVFGVLQAFSSASFALLQAFPHSVWILASVITFEDFCTALGTVAFTTFMAAMTNKKFSATQYAILSSLTGVSRSIIAAPSGFLITAVGWTPFFIFCGLLAMPGLWLVQYLLKAPHSGSAVK